MFDSDTRQISVLAQDKCECSFQVTEHGGQRAQESVDGKFLYYTKVTNIRGIWKVPVEGGEETLVLDHNRAGYWRSWDVVEQGIYFATENVPNNPVLEFYDFTTGEITHVADLDGSLLRLSNGLSVSDDGRWILFAKREMGGSDIMLVEDFK